MISKEEYIRLYCDENLAKQGVYALNMTKVMLRMSIDVDQTLQDLDDYGLGEAMKHNNISDVKVMNTKTGEQRSLMRNELDHHQTEKQTRTLTPILDSLLK